MTQNRTVEIMLTREQVADVQDITGFEKFNAAIGYLSAWNMSFPQVSISGGVWDENPEMTRLCGSRLIAPTSTGALS